MENKMKIKEIKIKNFRSIIESETILIDDRITVLAGKNESGKTTILKALNAFGNDLFEEIDKPNGKTDANPTVIVKYEIVGKELMDLLPLAKEKEIYDICIERSKSKYDKIKGSLKDIIDDYLKNEVLDLFSKIEVDKGTSFIKDIK